jgi:hypothetical protein
MPACAAMGWLVATAPRRATTSDRVWSNQLLARLPRTAVILAPGLGIDSVGRPNGVGLGPPALAVDRVAPDALATPILAVPPNAANPIAVPPTFKNERRDVLPAELSDIRLPFWMALFSEISIA